MKKFLRIKTAFLISLFFLTMIINRYVVYASESEEAAVWLSHNFLLSVVSAIVGFAIILLVLIFVIRVRMKDMEQIKQANQVIDDYNEKLEFSNQELLKQKEELQEQYTKLKRKNSEINHLVYYDMVSGYSRREYFIETIDARDQEKEDMVLFGIHMGNLKHIDEAYGYQFGDIARQKVGGIIIDAFGGLNAIYGRYYDNFYVGCCCATSLFHLERQLLKLTNRLNRVITIGDHETEIYAYIGVVYREGDTGSELMAKADMTIIELISQKNLKTMIYSKEFHDKMLMKMQLEVNLKRAVEENEFQLYYQPQVCVDTGRVIGCEALIRWRSGDHYTSPAMFIPLAEEIGVIHRIGIWVLKTAAKDLRYLKDRGIHCPIAVNISPRQINMDLLEDVEEVLNQYDIAQKELYIEITETALMTDFESNIAVLKALSAHGIGIALDDFGVGYSSLNYIRLLPIDKLKIDRSFVVAMDDQRQKAILSIMIQLAKLLGLETVSEGVETKKQFEALKTLGIDLIQGWYFSKALPIDDFIQYYNQSMELDK